MLHTETQMSECSGTEKCYVERRNVTHRNTNVYYSTQTFVFLCVTLLHGHPKVGLNRVMSGDDRLVRTVRTVEKVFFVCSILATEHLIVLVHDIIDRGFQVVLELVDHYRNHVSVRVSGSRLTSESCPVREKTYSTLTSGVR